MYGADAISQVPAENRNVKLNLVTETFFDGDKPSHNVNDFSHYGRPDPLQYPTIDRIMNILKIPESREIFGLTFRDLIELDGSTLEYINNAVLELYKQRQDMMQKEEAKHRDT